MKILLLILILFPSTRPAFQDEKPPLLQITIDGWGVVWPQGKHNYLTVWPDGNVIYLQKAKRGLVAQVTDAVSPARLEQIKAISKEFRNFKFNQPASARPLDYRMTVHIEIQGQTFDIPHYDFHRPDELSAPVYKLLCLADSIRDEPYALIKPATCGSIAQ